MLAEKRRHFEALAALLAANVFWGLSFPLIKAILRTHAALDPAAGGWFLTAMTVAPRFILASLALAAWGAWRSRGSGSPTTRAEWTQGVSLGLFTAGGMLLQNDGLQFTHASTSAFLTQFYAVLIPVWIGIRIRKLPALSVWISVALVLAGTATLARLDWHKLQLGRGESETLLSSIFYAGQILVLSQARYARNRAMRVTLLTFVTQGLIFLVLSVALAPSSASLLVPWTSFAWLTFTICLTVFCTLGAFILMIAFQPRITATEAGLIYSFEPVASSLMALFLPAWLSLLAGITYANETLTSHLLLGGCLITIANIVLQVWPPANPFESTGSISPPTKPSSA